MSENKQKDTKEEVDILDQVRIMEKNVKARMLMKKIVELKELCKDIKEDKEECVIILQEIGIDEKDIKRIIDFINNSADVDLTEEDKKQIRERVKKNVKNERERLNEKVSEMMTSTSPSISKSWCGSDAFYTGTAGGSLGCAGTTNNAIMMNLSDASNGNQLEVKI